MAHGNKRGSGSQKLPEKSRSESRERRSVASVHVDHLAACVASTPREEIVRPLEREPPASDAAELRNRLQRDLISKIHDGHSMLARRAFSGHPNRKLRPLRS